MTHHKGKRRPTPTPPAPTPPVPEAYKFLNYPGDRTAAVGQVMGPTYSGREVLTVVDAVYDQEADRTRLGLAYGIHKTGQAAS